MYRLGCCLLQWVDGRGCSTRREQLRVIFLVFFSTHNTSVYIKFSSNTLLTFTKLSYTCPLDEAGNFFKQVFITGLLQQFWIPQLIFVQATLHNSLGLFTQRSGINVCYHYKLKLYIEKLDGENSIEQLKSDDGRSLNFGI